MAKLTKFGFVSIPWRSRKLAGYFERMSKDDLNQLHDGYVDEVLRAQGFIAPESPRSIYRVEKLYEALMQYSPERAFYPLKTECLKAGFAFAYAAFSREPKEARLQALPLDLDSVDLLTKNPEASAGLTNEGETKSNSMLVALEKARRILANQKAPEPCIAFKRTQFGDKTRLVWGYPYSMTILEGLVAQPLIEKMKEGKTPMAFAVPTGVLGTRLRVASYNKKYAYSLDMSHFDSTVSAPLISFAFNVIRTWFDLDQVVYDGWTVRDVLGKVEWYFMCTPILMPDGNVYRGKRHGVPSGSYFTQLVDSIVNCVLVGSISAKFRLNVNLRYTFVLGDDMLFWSDRRVELKRIAKFVFDELGMVIHGDEKSKIYRSNQTIHFLGRDWTKGVPDLALEEILKRMVYPESYRKYSLDPKERKLQVKLLILGMASIYRTGWLIAQDTLGDAGSCYRDFETIEAPVYNRGSVIDMLTGGRHLTGFLRYRNKYVLSKGDRVVTTTALLFWL